MTVRPFGSGADRRPDLPSAYASNGGTRIRHAPGDFLRVPSGAGAVAVAPDGRAVAGAPTAGDTLARWTLP